MSELPAKSPSDGLPARAPDTPYSEEVALTVCNRLANGETLTSICEDPALPARRTVYDWAARRPEFAKAYQEARERQAHALFDEAIDLSRHIAFAKSGVTPQKVGAVRNLVDLMKWTAGKLNPKAYGDRVGAVPSIAIQINTNLGQGDGAGGGAKGGHYTLKAHPMLEEVGIPGEAAPAPAAPKRKPRRKPKGKPWQKKPKETGNATSKKEA